MYLEMQELCFKTDNNIQLKKDKAIMEIVEKLK